MISKSTNQTAKEIDKKGGKENLTRKHSEESETASSGDKPASKKVYKQTKLKARTNVKSKGSSGYGSMSSGSQHENQSPNYKYSIFKTSTNTEAATENEKLKALAGVYQSKVVVEDKKVKIGAIPSEQERVLAGKEADMYIHLKSTYQQSAEQEREKRKEKFFKKLQDIQIDSALQHNKELQLKSAKKEQAKKRQIEQLAHIRNKFEEERQRRYKSQYVTKNFLDYERLDRSTYGLPENYATKAEFPAKLKRAGGGKVTAREFLKREIKLKKNYNKMFTKQQSSEKSSMKEPKLEGKDKVTLEAFDAEGKNCVHITSNAHM